MKRSLPLALSLLAVLAACGETTTCPADQTLCDGGCAATATDPANCGACGISCATGQSCIAGSCVCDSGTTCGDACVDLASDPGHCGACDVGCAGSLLCTTPDGGAAQCAATCLGTGQTACGRACVDLETNRQNCGACGRACGTNERCDGGRCVADLYLACWNSAEVRGASAALQAAGVPLAVAPGPGNLAWIGDTLFVASARSGGVETLSAIRFDPPGTRVAPVLTTSTTNPDIQFLAEHGGLLYLSRSSAGSIYVATPQGTKVDEINLSQGAGNPNPLGVAFDGDVAYVALNESSEVVVLDVSGADECARGERVPPCLELLARIDVQPLASPGAKARPSRIAIANGRAYVTLWNLDEFWAPPAGSTGRLAVIRTDTPELDEDVADLGVKGLLELGSGCLNPAGATVLGDTLYVTCGAFAYPAILGSGIVEIDVSGAPEVIGFTPMADDEAPGALAFCPTGGYVADRNSGKVFTFDPMTMTVGSGVELCPEADGYAFVSDLACGF